MFKSLFLALLGTIVALALVACGTPDSAGRAHDSAPTYNLSSGHTSAVSAAPC